ncbi:FtsX-like permease family protein [Paenibacillus cisolokensis]|uniref:FtsX-like permease family protein n=1 Tax=Paenibacillus cisolokensis TaxID=1658519 RepID=UPI003D2973AD
MSGWKYVWSNMKHRSFLTGLTVVAVAVTVALFSLLLMSRDGVEEGARKGYGPFEVVIGAEGSESQLVLNTFYRVGAPTGNIPLETLEEVRNHGEVEAAFGMTTGDSYHGYPIVGIDPAYFVTRYDNQRLAEGSLYAELGEVTLGASVAKALNLKVGDTFTGAHGLVAHVDIDDDHEAHDAHDDHDDYSAHDDHEDHDDHEAHDEHEGEAADHAEDQGGGHAGHHDAHDDFHYTVVGILPRLNTADDRAIFTTMDYAWAVHHTDESHKEITAIVMKPRSLLGAQSLKTEYDAKSQIQAVYSSKAVADMLNMVDSGSQLLLIVMLICALLAAATLLLALTSSVQERKRDVGLLRLIGKSRMYILSCLIGEGVALTTAGIIVGIIGGRLAAWSISDLLFTQSGIQLQPLQMATNEWMLIVAALLLGFLASAGPALRVYRTDALTLFRN